MKKNLAIMIASVMVFGNTMNANAVYVSDTKGHWAETQIQKFVEAGYMDTTDYAKVRPNDSVTRAEFVKILNKYFGLTKTSGKVFTDTKNHWSKVEVDIAVTNGVATGTTDTTFSPNAKLTREQACVMIANYLDIADKNTNKLNAYKDAKNVSSWAKTSIEGMLEKGYIYGTNGKINAKSNITRAEAVATLNRIENGVKEPSLNPNNKYTSFNDVGFKNEVYKHLLDLVNEHRVNNKAEIVRTNQALIGLSTRWSEYMVEKNFFSHRDPVTNERAFEVFPQYTRWNAENIAMTYISGDATSKNAKALAQELFDMWKNSDGHNKNMLNPTLNTMGFGFKAVKDPKGYWKVIATQQFQI